MKKLILALALACMAGAAQAYYIKLALAPASGPGIIKGYSGESGTVNEATVYVFQGYNSSSTASTAVKNEFAETQKDFLRFLRANSEVIKTLDMAGISEYTQGKCILLNSSYKTDNAGCLARPSTPQTIYLPDGSPAGCYGWFAAVFSPERDYVFMTAWSTPSAISATTIGNATKSKSVNFLTVNSASANKYDSADFSAAGWYSTAASTGPAVRIEPWVEVDGQELTDAIDKISGRWSFTPQTSYNSVEICFPDGFTKQADTTVYLKMGAKTALKINKLKLNGAALNINSTDGGIDLLPYLTIPDADTDGFIDLTKVKLIEGYDWDESGHPAQRFVWIGDVGYMSLETAVAAAADSDVIKLTGDVAGSAVKIGKNLEIDLGGNVFDCNVAKQDFDLDGFAVGVAEGVTATIKNGTIKYTSSTVCSASVQTFGHLNVFGVTLAAADKDGNPYSVKYAVLGEGEIWSNTDPLTETNCCTDAGGKLVIVYPDEFYGYDVKRINQLPYTLTLSAEKGTLKTTEVQVFVQHEGEEYTFAADDNLSKVVIEGLKNTGYEHDGWAIDNGGGKTTKIVIGQTTITGDASLIAQYKPATYPITYYVGNGYTMTKQGVANSYVYGRQDALYSGLTSPIAGTGIDDYFVFDGWYMDESFTNGPYDRVPAEQMGPLKLYAKWTESEARNGGYYLTLAKAVEAANSNSTITVRRDIEGEALVVKRPMTFKGDTTDITLRRCTLTVKTDVTLTLNGVAFDDVTLDMTTEAASLEKGGRYELMKVAKGTAVPALTLAGLPDTWNVRWKNGSLWLYETPGLAIIVK